nr:c-type cytochrome [Nitrosomonas nitrosa]
MMRLSFDTGRRRSAIALLLAAAIFAWEEPASAADRSDAARGQKLYESRCAGCHSIDAHRIGPRHRGVFGRRAGTAAGYDYSPALRASGLIWDAPTLERWLANPTALVPGTRMGIRISDARDRRDIIAYLRSLATLSPDRAE